MDVAFLYRVLEGTLSADNPTRKAAEGSLKKMISSPGYIVTLLQLIEAPEMPPAGKSAAALAFKNAIIQHWHSDEPGVPSPFPDADKAAVRTTVIRVSVAQRQFVVRNALVEAVKSIFGHDYPDRWPGLPGELLSQLQGGNPHTIVVTAQLIRAMVRHYEFKQGAGRQGPAVMLVAAVFPALAQMGGVLVTHSSDEAGQVMRLIAKSYYSAAHFQLETHDCLVTPEAVVTWLGLFHRLLTKPLYQPGEAGVPVMPEDSEDREDWPWWRARKWATKVFFLWAERWGQPKLLGKDSAALDAAAAFNKAVAPQVTAALLSQLAEWAGPSRRYLPQSVLLYSMRFIQAALPFSSCWKAIKPHLGGLIDGVVVRLLSLTPEDLEAWESDPQDFMRGQADPFVSYGSPRTAAEMFMTQALEDRGTDAKPLLDAVVGSTLATYARAFSGPGGTLAPSAGLDAAAAQALVLRKEGVLRLVQSVSAAYRRDKKRRGTIEPLLTSFVLPDLTSPYPQLRARACELWANFADLKFKAPGAIEVATRGVLGCLSDPSDVVRVAAASSLRMFLERSEPAREIMRPHVGQLLDTLFALLESIGQDAVLETLSALVEAYSENMSALGGPILAKLLALWANNLAQAGITVDENGAVVDPTGSPSSDGGDGDNDDDGEVIETGPHLEDDAAMMADGIVGAIVTLMGALRAEGQAAVLLSLAPQLWRFAYGLLDPRGGIVLEFLDSAFSIVYDLAEALGEAGALDASDPAWATWARMLTCFRECAMDYLESMDIVVEVFFAYGLRRLTAPGPDPAHGGNNLDAWLTAVAATELSGEEDNRERMARLNIMLLHQAVPTQALPPAALASIVVTYAKAAHGAKTRKLAVSASNVVAQCLCYNAPATLAALEAAGATQLAFEAWFSALPRHRRSLACKISMLGFASLLRLPLESLPPVVKASLPHALRGIVFLQGEFEKSLVAEQEAREQAAEEDADWDDDGEGGDEEDGDDEDGAGAAGGQTGAGGTRFAPAPSDSAAADKKKLFGDDEDVVDEEEERAMLAAEERKARRLAGGDDDSVADSDGGSLYDEPPPQETPLDHISHLLHIEEGLAALARAGPAAGEVQRALTPDTLHALALLAAKAVELRAKGTQPGAFGPGPDEPNEAEGAQGGAAAAR